MDADLWFNTYKRYKSGTTKFTTWLIEEAKKKAGKAGVDKTQDCKYLIATRDFTKLAEVIVKSTKHKIQVPSSILALLDHVISLRKEYSRWVGQAADEGSRAQIESHLYFVNVFQQVKGTLRRQECAMPKGARPDEKDNRAPQEKDAVNMFETLSLEEPEGALDGLNSSVSVPTGPKAKTMAASKPVYDMESLYDEVLFSSVLFFQDLESIRKLIRKTWSEYPAGRTELSTASLLTNTAIELIQRSTKEHLDSIKRWPDAPEEKDFVYWFHAHICKEDITDRERPRDYIHMKTYEQAERISWPVSVFLRENLSSLKAHQMIWYGFEPLDLSRERDEMLARDKLEEDRRFINLMCSELHMFNKLITTQPPATDEVTRYFRDFDTSQCILLWLVFATQLMVGMKWVLHASRT